MGSVAQFDRVELVSTEHDQQEDRREDLESIVLLEVIVREALDELPRVAHVDRGPLVRQRYSIGDYLAKRN